jgi:hypothetical protein
LQHILQTCATDCQAAQTLRVTNPPLDAIPLPLSFWCYEHFKGLMLFEEPPYVSP